MKKTISLLLALCLMLAAFAGCGTSPESGIAESSSGSVDEGSSNVSSAASTTDPGDKILNLYTWEAMFPQEILKGFEQETGIKVNYVNFDYDETMLAKLEAAKGGDYDVVVADDYIIELAIQQGLVQKLDKARLSNYGSINPVYQGQFFDPKDEYTVPYGAGVQTIVYDPAVVKTEIKGYADLWDASLKDSLGLSANYRVINGMALKVMGESYNIEDTAKIEEAGKKLLELAPNVRLIKDDNLQDDLISGEISAAVMYTSQVTMAKLANPELKVVFPEEGVGFGVMAQFIPVNAPHPDAAYRFIDYILTPENAAKCFEALGYYCTNKDADSLISEEYRDFLTLPDDLDESKMEMIGNISSAAMDAHDKVWTEFKSACGQ